MAIINYRREARRKESNDRAPRTSGALYRRSATAPGSYVNADVPEGAPDPFQVCWREELKEGRKEGRKEEKKEGRKGARKEGHDTLWLSLQEDERGYRVRDGQVLFVTSKALKKF